MKLATLIEICREYTILNDEVKYQLNQLIITGSTEFSNSNSADLFNLFLTDVSKVEADLNSEIQFLLNKKSLKWIQYFWYRENSFSAENNDYFFEISEK